MYWYPNRCEHASCAAELPKFICSACKVVKYCTKEHQKEDWPLHKGECKVFQRCGIQALFYDDADVLAKFPIKTAASLSAEMETAEASGGAVTPGSFCALCKKNASQVRLGLAPCCVRPICNNDDEYVMFSYTRELCLRSHSRYTLCGSHSNNCRDAPADWRRCTKCRDQFDTHDFLWYGLNPYNFYPLLSTDVPRHGLCSTCGVCRRKFLSGEEGSSVKFTAGGRVTTCTGCAGC